MSYPPQGQQYPAHPQPGYGQGQYPPPASSGFTKTLGVLAGLFALGALAAPVFLTQAGDTTSPAYYTIGQWGYDIISMIAAGFGDATGYTLAGLVIVIVISALVVLISGFRFAAYRPGMGGKGALVTFGVILLLAAAGLQVWSIIEGGGLNATTISPALISGAVSGLCAIMAGASAKPAPGFSY